LRIDFSPKLTEENWQKLQKWDIASLRLFLLKYLVHGPNFVQIAHYYADPIPIRTKLLVNLYWMVKKQFKLDKIRREMLDVYRNRWEMITAKVDEVTQDWFAKRDGLGQILSSYERIESLYDICKIVNGKKKQAGTWIADHSDKDFLLEVGRNKRLHKQLNKNREPSYVDFEQKTGIKILESADDLKNELQTTSTDLSKESSPAKPN
jgi:hypothetical protein